MTGHIIHHVPRRVPHHCELPYDGHSDGTIWQCDCGQHYEVRGDTWEAISARRAQRIIQRAKRQP